MNFYCSHIENSRLLNFYRSNVLISGFETYARFLCAKRTFELTISNSDLVGFLIGFLLGLFDSVLRLVQWLVDATLDFLFSFSFFSFLTMTSHLSLSIKRKLLIQFLICLLQRLSLVLNLLLLHWLVYQPPIGLLDFIVFLLIWADQTFDWAIKSYISPTIYLLGFPTI